ncbi:hypothetical protein VCHA37P191_120140 [Vibrio chagasii]|nr:hypothetical protein VCHA37P191_120140 [Vibrio chagasii]CAH6960990.1 hypothetical protein VCHA49P380_130140 [Vibrio chagasii]
MKPTTLTTVRTAEESNPSVEEALKAKLKQFMELGRAQKKDHSHSDSLDANDNVVLLDDNNDGPKMG